jgi:hypothetical protein
MFIMKKEWKDIEWSDECPECGSSVEVLTNCNESNQAYDGDRARCTSCHAGGWVSADGEKAYINWSNE